VFDVVMFLFLAAGFIVVIVALYRWMRSEV